MLDERALTCFTLFVTQMKLTLLGATTAKRTAGFRSWHYDVIVIVLGVVVGIVILATIIRAFVMYRRDKFRLVFTCLHT